MPKNALFRARFFQSLKNEHSKGEHTYEMFVRMLTVHCDQNDSYIIIVHSRDDCGPSNCCPIVSRGIV